MRRRTTRCGTPRRCVSRAPSGGKQVRPLQGGGLAKLPALVGLTAKFDENIFSEDGVREQVEFWHLVMFVCVCRTLSKGTTNQDTTTLDKARTT